jgi:Fur family peroxide stress response transcriptional regulator
MLKMIKEMVVMDYKALLKEKKLAATPQRLEIISLLSSHGHLSIDELYKLLVVNFSSISLATVYKNIHIMTEKSFLTELQIPNKKNVYELIKDTHSHVVCSKCKKILDIDIDTTAVFNEATQKSHFKLQISSIVFNGTCPKCA